MTNPSYIDLMMQGGEDAVFKAFGWMNNPTMLGWGLGLLFSFCVYAAVLCFIFAGISGWVNRGDK